MAVMVYALIIYQMRAKAIRLRTGAPYDDRLGPVSTAQYGAERILTFQTVLCVCLLGMFS
jgi:hypothetical protein